VEAIFPVDVVNSSRDQGPLVGRVREMAVVRRQFRRASAGVGQIVLVEGEAGVGKTRFVEEFAAEGRRPALRCFVVRGGWQIAIGRSAHSSTR
jgi:transcriptional regulator with AAA-type ATPase domain